MIKGSVANRKLFELFSKPGEGKIIGVFSSGIYFDYSGRTILLHDEQGGALPFGISLPRFNGHGHYLGLEADMPVCCETGNLLRLGKNLYIQLVYTECTQKITSRDNLRLFFEYAKDLLLRSEKSAFSIYGIKDTEKFEKSQIADIFARAAYTGINELSCAMEENSADRVEYCLSKLVGLGRGLTPSMDDFLCGMLFVFHYSKNYWDYKAKFLDVLSSCVKELALQNTNAYSAAYIISAAEGEDFSLMRQCLESAADEDFFDCVNRLLSVGSSSGADMLSGMCFAAKYILKQQNFTL